MKLASAPWQDKIERAELLSSQQDATRDLLRFYSRLLQFQQELEKRLGPTTSEVHQLARFVPEFLALLDRIGTPQMKEFAAEAMDEDWTAVLGSAWNERGNAESTQQSFVAHALLQPFAHNLASRSSINLQQIAPTCPFCFSAPQLGVLRPEGEGGKRYLLCTLCGTEWEYRRVICPNCEESDKEKLPVYKSDQVPHIKLAACETCHTYLKCIDLGIDGHAIPEIDDVASLPMSLWMTQNGFQPMRLNLFGF